MTETKIEKIIQKYIASSVLRGKATLDGDYKTNNKEYKNLVKLYREIEKDHYVACKVLESLFENADITVKMTASAHALGLNIYVERAVEILRDISTMQGIGILRFDAEMILKVWKEQGYLKF